MQDLGNDLVRSCQYKVDAHGRQIMSGKVMARSRIPMTQPERYAASARLIRKAMDTLVIAAATAPPGTCHDLAALLEPHAEAMERGVSLPHDGTVSYPEVPV